MQDTFPDGHYDALDAIALGLPRPGPLVATSAQVDELLRDLFPSCRTTRSSAYMAGVAAQLRLMLRRERLVCPYAPGSAEFDAFFAGADEGAGVAQLYLESLA